MSPMRAVTRAVIRAVLRLLPLLAAAGLTLGALLAPLAEGAGRGEAAGVLYALLGGVCHQVPTRSLFLGASHMALCGRCFALWGSGAVAGLAALWLRVRPLPPAPTGFLVLPCLMDGLAPSFSFWPQTMASRTFTGILAGSAIALFLYPRYLKLIDGAFAKRSGPTQ